MINEECNDEIKLEPEEITEPENDMRQKHNSEQRQPDLISNGKKLSVQNGELTVGNWLEGVYICEICSEDCGHSENLKIHLKKRHNLFTSIKALFIVYSIFQSKASL